MKVRVHSADLSRALNVLNGVMDSRVEHGRAVEITDDPNGLILRVASSEMSIRMAIPMMGGDGECVCVDGQMLRNVVRMCRGEVTITTNEKSCLIEGNGRTRIPVLAVQVPRAAEVSGKEIVVRSETLGRIAEKVMYAISQESARPILTGMMVESEHGRLRAVALDGFQLSTETCEARCEEGIHMVIPGKAVKQVAQCLADGEDVRITADRHRVRFVTDEMELVCVLLNGEFVDYKRILPDGYRVSAKVRVDALKDIVKASTVTANKNNLVKLRFAEDKLTVSSNSEVADFEGDVECMTEGDGVRIAFNSGYLQNALNAIDSEYVIFRMNSGTTPAVLVGDGDGAGDGFRLVLPVRVAGD